MAFADSVVVALLGLGTLLFLGIHTLLKCGAEPKPRRDDLGGFLFEGKSPLHAIASTVGATFSVSYFGATVIYGHLFKGWFLITLAPAALLALRLINQVITIHAQLPDCPANQNPLLAVLERRLSRKHYQAILKVYAAIYFLLLVEELAVSRLSLSIAFPLHPALPAILLATICLVVLAYLRWGGYKALLISDLEQLKLIIPFLLALGFILLRGTTRFSGAAELFSIPSLKGYCLMPLILLFVVAWLASPVDLYSRLNFARTQDNALRPRRSVVRVSLLFALGSFVVGAAFGLLLPPEFASRMTPSTATAFGISYVLDTGSHITTTIFFASLFFMIFTTLDTLLFTLLQIRFHRREHFAVRKTMTRTLLIAVLLSILVPTDAVSLIGIFLASLMLLPLFVILAEIGACSRSLVGNLRLEVPFVLSIAGLVAVTLVFRLDFYDYFFLPGLVLICLLGTEVVARLFVRIAR